MKYLFDTSVVIDLLRQKIDTWNFLENHKKDEIISSSICKAEVMVGIYHSKSKNIESRKKLADDLFESFSEVVDFDDEMAEIAGRIKAKLLFSGKIIDDFDVLIAATAIAKNATVVTSNVKHFARVENLRILTV